MSSLGFGENNVVAPTSTTTTTAPSSSSSSSSSSSIYYTPPVDNVSNKLKKEIRLKNYLEQQINFKFGSTLKSGCLFRALVPRMYIRGDDDDDEYDDNNEKKIDLETDEEVDNFMNENYSRQKYRLYEDQRTRNKIIKSAFKLPFKIGK